MNNNKITFMIDKIEFYEEIFYFLKNIILYYLLYFFTKIFFAK